MSGTFRLEIKLGNDAMQTPGDVSNALRDAAIKLGSFGDWNGDDSGIIRDLNGNTVGTWEVTP
jgi:hypothetical protein